MSPRLGIAIRATPQLLIERLKLFLCLQHYISHRPATLDDVLAEPFAFLLSDAHCYFSFGHTIMP
jgi:hypothetical protein